MASTSTESRVSLAFRELSELSPSLVSSLALCKILDLTSNQISDIMPLRDLPFLEELILDDNRIDSHTKFPTFPKLSNLWVNRNQISSLTTFVDKLIVSCPDLIMLSMLNNEACPNYFNDGSPTQYQDYRYYVIHRLPKLQVLDTTPISTTEREAAHQKYAGMTSTTVSEATRRQNEQQYLTKKRAEREERRIAKEEEKVIMKQKRRRQPSTGSSLSQRNAADSTESSLTSTKEASDGRDDAAAALPSTVVLPEISPDVPPPKSGDQAPRVLVLPPITKRDRERYRIPNDPTEDEAEEWDQDDDEKVAENEEWSSGDEMQS